MYTWVNVGADPPVPDSARSRRTAFARRARQPARPRRTAFARGARQPARPCRTASAGRTRQTACPRRTAFARRPTAAGNAAGSAAAGPAAAGPVAAGARRATASDDSASARGPPRAGRHNATGAGVSPAALAGSPRAAPRSADARVREIQQIADGTAARDERQEAHSDEQAPSSRITPHFNPQERTVRERWWPEVRQARYVIWSPDQRPLSWDDDPITTLRFVASGRSCHEGTPIDGQGHAPKAPATPQERTIWSEREGMKRVP